MPTFICIHPGCHAGPFAHWSPECPRCGSRGSLTLAAPAVNGQPFGSPGYRAMPRRRPASTSLPDLLDRHRPVRRIHWGYDQLKLPKTARVLLYGPPGGGKSTLATFIALSLGEQGFPVLVLAAEEGHGESLLERFSRCADRLNLASLPRDVVVADVESLPEAEEDIARWRSGISGGILVLDSVTELRASTDWLRQVLADDKLGAILVAHQTTTGAPRGGWSTAYAVEVVIRVQGLRAKATKSRWCSLEEWSVLEPVELEPELGRERGVVVPLRPGGMP